MLNPQRVRSAGLSLMSIFIVWHLVAMLVVGPFHKSEIRSSMIGSFENYLWFLKLDGAWSFYAPNPPYGVIFRYETVSSLGEKKIYPLTEAKHKYEHAYVRHINFYLYFFFNPGYTTQNGYDKSVARYLCDRHAEADVKEITFHRNLQKRFTPKDYLSGKNPYSEEFLTRFVHGPYPCERVS